MFSTTYDALVIGAGATGSFAAKELTEQGLSVLLLEAGPAIDSQQDFDPTAKSAQSKEINIWERARASLRGQPVQARAAFFSERFSHFFVNDRKHPYTTPPDAPFLWIRGHQTGGRLHSFGRVLLRWSDEDFKVATRSGKGEDWPISYADVAPFYDEVETCLKLHGNSDGVATMPDGKYARPARLSPAEERFKCDVERCWPERHVVSWRYIAPEPVQDRTPQPLKDALATGRLTIVNNAITRRITVSESTGLASGADYIDRQTGRSHHVAARSVVLSASPIESVRLLLNSATAGHPDGLGNRSGVLGRYFMDQVPCLASGAYARDRGWFADETTPMDPFYDPSGGVFITRSDATADLSADGFAYQGSIGRMKVAGDTPSRLSFMGFGQMLPHADNRITLDRRKKDAWGIPVPHIRCAMHESEEALLDAMQGKLLEILHGVGGELEFIGSPRGLTEMGAGAFPNADGFSRFLFRRWFRKTMCMGAAIHESGGARMGSSPETSVLNAYNQSWEVPNLIVTDASAFVSSGTVGTTLTGMALTLRACRHLASELSKS